jgi:hypothetical protein
MGRRPILCMDQDFSRALVGAALKSGFVKFDKDFDSVESSVILDGSATRRLRRPALEMAILFDKLSLFGLPTGINLERFEAEGMLALTMAGEMVEGHSGPPPEGVFFFKRILSEVAWRRSNRSLRYLGKPPASRRLIAELFDQMAEGVSLGATVRTMKGVASKLMVSTETFSAVESEAAETLFSPLLSRGHDPLALGICFFEVVSSVIAMWNLICFSLGVGDPFISHQLANVLGPGSSGPSDRQHVFNICQIAMKEEIGYAPVVTGIDDVLRLRNDKRIIRFRQLLEEWCATLPSGDVALLKTIKADMQKANKELRHLDKWRTVDRWLFWAQLPTTLIPIVSTLVTVVSFGVHLKLEHGEKNCWVGIGR